jgi:hypothetical protein
VIVYIVKGYTPQEDDGSEQASVIIGVYDDSYRAEEARNLAQEKDYEWVTINLMKLNDIYVC